MDNLLNYRQKIGKRYRQGGRASKLSNITVFSPFSSDKIMKKTWNKSLYPDSNRKSYRPLSKNRKDRTKNVFKSSIRGQYLILPEKLVKHVSGIFRNSLERKNNNSFFRKLKKAVHGKFLLANIALITLFLGFITSATIYSYSFSKPGEFILHDDGTAESVITAYAFPADDSSGKPFGDVDLSLIKGFTIHNHVVKRGESLSVIAQKYKVDTGTIISFNNIKNARLINTGATIKVPDRNGLFYKVSKGDSLSTIAGKFGTNLNDILDINNITSDIITPGQELFIPGAKMNSFDLKKALGELFIFPVSGRLTSPYGYRNDPFTGKRMMHYGIDLANMTGTPVRATLDGKVLMCGYSSVYGNYIILRHQGNYQSLYAHLEKFRVKEGETVVQNQIIGDMGNTGRSTGSHLHFSIYHKQKPVDPLTLLSR